MGGNIYSSPATKLDEELSSTSINAVQNKVIKAELDNRINTNTDNCIKFLTLPERHFYVGDGSFTTGIYYSNDDNTTYFGYYDNENNDIYGIGVLSSNNNIRCVFRRYNRCSDLATEDYVKTAISYIKIPSIKEKKVTALFGQAYGSTYIIDDSDVKKDSILILTYVKDNTEYYYIEKDYNYDEDGNPQYGKVKIVSSYKGNNPFHTKITYVVINN